MRNTIPLPTALVVIAYLVACDNVEPLAPTAGTLAAVAAQAAVTRLEEPFAFEGQCPQGFTVTNVGIASGQLLLLPAGGTPLRSELRLSLRGTLTNTTSGETMPNYADFTIVTDLVTGESQVSGAGFHLVSRGAGIVVLDAGTIRFDAEGHVTFEGGRHDFYDGQFEAAECEALS